MRKYCLPLLLILVAVLSLSGCRWDIWGSTPENYLSGTGQLDSSASFTGAAPAHMYVTQARYAEKIIVSWDPVVGADYYELYKTSIERIGEDQTKWSWKKVLTMPTVPTYTDTDVNPGIKYAYRVRARSKINRSLFGSVSEIGYGWVLAAPENLTASQATSTKSIELTWNAVDGVKSYKIEYSATGYGEDWNAIDKIPAPPLEDTPTYLYYPKKDKGELGKSLFFRVSSIAETESEPSAKRVGFTYVVGAPKAPENVKASRGDSKSQIEVSWTKMEGTAPDGSSYSYNWEIFRSSPGAAEEKIYSTVNGLNEDPLVSGDRMYIVDTNGLNPGVEYTYSIQAIGNIYDDDEILTGTANGLPSLTTGFLFSPPTTASAKIVQDTGGRYGFSISFEPALGTTESKDIVANQDNWFYVVSGRVHSTTGTPNEWTAVKQDIPINDVNARTLFYAYDGEGSFDEFTVYTVNKFNAGEDQKSADYEQVTKSVIGVSVPAAPDSFAASDNTVYSGMQSSSEGLYPVAILVSKDDKSVKYDIRIWESVQTGSPDATTANQKLDDVVISEVVNGMLYVEVPSPASVGVMWTYQIRGIDVLGRKGEWSDLDTGYGAITGKTLIKYMQIYCLKPWEYLDTDYLTVEQKTKWSNSAIYGYIKQAGMGSLGTTSENGSVSGSVKYSAVVQGVGGRVSFTYTKFSEVSYMNTTGSYTMNVNMSGTGSCDGALTVSGWYPSAIDFGPINVESQKFVGTYKVTQSNGTAAENIAP